MATSEGIPSSIDIEFLELNDNPYTTSIVNGIFPFYRNLLLCMSQRTAKERNEK